MDPISAQLVRDAIEGDQKAYAEIVHRYRNQIYNLILRMVRRREEAEDLTQETFIKAFNALSSFNAEYAFSTWLYKIAVNNCIDHFRKKRLKTYPLDNPIPARDGELQREFPDHEAGPDAGLMEKERHLTIQEAIDSLPGKYREAILLRHAQDRSYEEIARLLGIPIGTVKVRIFRAREMLKKKLRDQRKNLFS
ncbi:MAG: ECF RNA polymerase sigma factor SigW [bacterium ADurb.Bin431]|nr:MAG: ECF RNA polymerase sigma factor SigW [bacterium ADurb.Bin431]HNY91814.1 sigma-70 family RNA polymerase sigma factor [bacterium]HOC24803.1 sigma-70 family RNA polymerase sigma factor [bacterium]HOH06819.1 sigma-70 family RNA polymerase sigma factor [bacterium]HOY43465.1 sigma-70 family RNA polymerase sigma factor [bacterium]